ncbi:HlyD family secretion protein [Pseudodesulfovibrio piezophilus]|uniref:Multidrug resistance transporter HlyD/EmrA/FusE n=1 Tax=Pseudodesulfovibrio piezophilus (strain DSM 21447 / JCM 15486 / C1TLV30) TaxID=1322246 RepID=M1WKU4_PSEP2|nr:HlyD family secretion protein [Pseudodesulfovibrio piezophilus]CCH50201.1 Multidrug resistance transporter HlyD/EmrA/FusE [Pseudodesulfovibrio piezophilus C1TLV30]
MSNEKMIETSPLSNSESGKEKKNTRKILLIGGLLTIAALAVGYPFYRHAMTHEATDDAFVEARVVTMSPRVAGHVSEVFVADNQVVHKGDLLAQIDSRDFEVALDIASARVESAKAALTEADALASAARNILVQKGAEVSTQHAELAEIQASIAEVKAGYDRDETDLVRMQTIAKAGAVSRQEFDHARAQEAMTRAKLNSAHRQVDTQSAKITQARATVKAAEDELKQAYAQVAIRMAELREAEAEMQRANLNLSYTHITAPSDGYITKKNIEPGAYVQVGQKLFSIVNPSIWVVANFKETQISDMKPGQPVEIEVDAYPDLAFKGRVDSIQRGTGSRFTLLPPENATGNYIKVVQRVPVKIILDAGEFHGGHTLVPGMSVIPSVDIASKDIKLPSGAETVAARETVAQ